MDDPIHDFVAKLQDPSIAPTLEKYVAWRRDVAKTGDGTAAKMPEIGPISINLDLTTACNFRCDHCIDWDVLNLKMRHREAELSRNIETLRKRGLRSVILIGGGEVTLYPRVVEFVAFLKSLGLQVAVVSNGSRGDRLTQAAAHMSTGDWIRLSLDAGSNALFKAMHKPVNRDLDLDEICSYVLAIRAAAPNILVGYSFIIVWQGAQRDAIPLKENIQEIAMAARRAKAAGFHYITYKAVLERSVEGSEVMDPNGSSRSLDDIIADIRAQLAQAHKIEDDTFAVRESTNIRALETGDWHRLKRQPQTCHMQMLRQVLTPLGLYNCPAHRGVDWARIADKDAYADSERTAETAVAIGQMLDKFNAREKCAEVTCTYNAANWWIEGLISGEASFPSDDEARPANDYFL